MTTTYRILVVDDNTAIHEDFRKILMPPPADEVLAAAERALFNLAPAESTAVTVTFDLTFATQGEQAVELAASEHTEFALAFVDMRMPPGLNGIETARRLWALEPDLQIVICTAYADVDWPTMAAELGAPDRWVILKKPFDNIEVIQLAHALTEKWTLRQKTKAHLLELERTVAERTARLEMTLQRLRAEVLERERGERERQQIERKLEQTQRLESLGVLAGGVAHDFNNILTGILIGASMARMDVPPESEPDKQLRLIEENARRAAELCEQMLTYAGKTRVNPRPLDLNALLRETLELLHVTVPKDAELLLELTDGLPTVMGDAGRLRQIFMNLVLNAAEALTEMGPRSITLMTGRRSLDAAALDHMTQAGDAKPGEYVVVEVSDTGRGMTPDVIRRIFEPFFTTKFTGRGLGLCAVLGIIRSHDGALDVVSTPGTGTTFRVYFPACVNPQTAGATSPVAVAQPGVRLTGTVLVADDEESVRMVASAVLRRLGLTVREAGDGAEAIEVAGREESLVGVVIDVTMPRLDGPAALAVIRQLHPTVPAVLMTGFHTGNTDLTNRLVGLRRVAVLQKPFSVEVLTRLAAQEFSGPPTSLVPASVPQSI